MSAIVLKLLYYLCLLSAAGNAANNAANNAEQLVKLHSQEMEKLQEIADTQSRLERQMETLSR